MQSLINKNIGQCEYCNKEHDLRVACFEYASKNYGTTKESWDDDIYFHHLIEEFMKCNP